MSEQNDNNKTSDRFRRRLLPSSTILKPRVATHTDAARNDATAHTDGFVVSYEEKNTFVYPDVYYGRQ